MSLRFHQVDSQDSDKGEWLVTYADMVSLLLTFFIMLVAMSIQDTDRFKSALTSIQTSLGGQPTVETTKRPGPSTSQIIGTQEQRLQNRVNDVLRTFPTPIQEAVTSQFDRGRLLLTVNDQALFQAGQAALRPEAAKVLDAVAQILQSFPEYRIDIKGHTDSTPIATPQFPSNWELSAVRATTVLRYMLGKGVSAFRMTATGLADIDPIAPNDTPVNRAINRRVEFVLEKER